MKHVLSTLDYPDKDPEIARKPDPLIVGRARHMVLSGAELGHVMGASAG